VFNEVHLWSVKDGFVMKKFVGHEVWPGRRGEDGMGWDGMGWDGMGWAEVHYEFVVLVSTIGNNTDFCHSCKGRYL